VEANVFRRREIREILNEFVFVDLHLDGAEKIGQAVRTKNAGLAESLGKSTAMPIYVVVNPHDRQVINTWGWEDADPKRWKQHLQDVLMRWKNLRPK
jgi:hypothetical protein